MTLISVNLSVLVAGWECYVGVLVFIIDLLYSCVGLANCAFVVDLWILQVAAVNTHI